MSPIVATILLVAITVVLAAVLYVLVSGLARGGNPKPIGSAMALGTPTPAQGAGGVYWENLSVASASSGITWNNVDLEVLSPNGTVVATVTSFTVVGILGASSPVCSSPGPTETSWTSGSGTTPLSSTQTLSIQSSVPLVGAKDVLRVIGVRAFSGTESVTIP